MRKLIILIMAFLLPLSALEMRADDKEQIKKIPLWRTDGSHLRRDFVVIPIESYYYASMEGLITTATNLGDVVVNISNMSTGESWSNIFDSSTESQSFFQISGTPGYYGIEYVTESGEIYSGEFIIE